MSLIGIETAQAQTCPTGGPQYYVGNAGDDAAAGTSAAPWKNLSKVNGFKFGPNACIHMVSDLAGNLSIDDANTTGPVGIDCANHTITSPAATPPTITLTTTKGVDLINCNPVSTGAGNTVQAGNVNYKNVGIISMGLASAVAPPAPADFSVKTAIPASPVAGQFPLAGVAGSNWLNVAVFDPNWVKLSADTKPDAAGQWSLLVDTTKLAKGADAINVVAFSVPPNQTGGTNAQLPLTLSVDNTAPPPPPPAQMVAVNYSALSPIPAGSGPGFVLGTISVQETGGIFGGTLTLPSNETRFKIVGGTLQPAVVLAGGTYSTTITATQAGVAGSPKSIAVSVVVSPTTSGGLNAAQKALLASETASLAAAKAAVAKLETDHNAFVKALGQ